MKVLIVGGNRGIGLALVEKFLSEGHDVIATCRESSKELGATKATVIENVDVESIDSLKNAASKVDGIDIFIHNAGILIGDGFNSINFEDMLRQFEINSLAPLKSVLSFKDKINSGGKIGLMTSRMGSIADNDSGGSYGYRASKCALNAIGKSLANDLASEQKAVFLLHPGWVKTRMTGNSGLIDTVESAQGLYTIMMEKPHEQTGSFWHTNGDELPW